MMQIKNEIQLDFKDVLIEPKRSSLKSRSEVSLVRTFKFCNSNQSWTGVPIIAANMDTVGTISMAKSLGKFDCMTALHKHYKKETLVEFFGSRNTHKTDTGDNLVKNVFYSLGITTDDVEKFENVLSEVGYWSDNIKNGSDFGIKLVCIDVANGYMQKFVDFCKEFRRKHPNLIIMAGNVVTGNIVEELIFNGVDIVKAGIGPGSACTTRRVAGVGRPQLSTIIDTTDAAHGINGRVCSDGGCNHPGDVSKAFAAGADFVMLGGMLAGHEESEIEPIIAENGDMKVPFYGMSSSEAMKKYNGGVSDYRASEGRVIELHHRGLVENTILEILGGVRSTCTYVGAKDLRELSKRTTFYRTTIQTNNVFESSQKGK